MANSRIIRPTQRRAIASRRVTSKAWVLLAKISLSEQQIIVPFPLTFKRTNTRVLVGAPGVSSRAFVHLFVREQEPSCYDNAAVLRTNSMRYLPNYFAKGSLAKLFFCFPDPHFKVKNHRRRIVSDHLLAEYAFVLQAGGRLYCITDVEELHRWHAAKGRTHSSFRCLGSSDDDGGGAALAGQDPAVGAMVNTTEEGAKVARAGSSKYWVVFERVSDEEAADAAPPLFA